MNRKERRAAAKGATAPAADALFSEARLHFAQGRAAEARDLCERALARAPAHVEALNLLAVIAQQAGRHKLAVKYLAQAVAADGNHAGCHYNLAVSCQALGERDQAVTHFRLAIALGMTDDDIVERVGQLPVVAAGLARLAQSWPLDLRTQDLFGAGALESLAGEAFFQGALVSLTLKGWTLEAFLTHLRAALLRLVQRDPQAVGDAIVDLLCALAQQCFITEYIFTQDAEETRFAVQARDAVSAAIARDGAMAPALLAAAAAYAPLHAIANIETLIARDWPASLARLLRQQVSEPLEEARDLGAIPVLTPVEDRVSREVMRQYEENPYPRWVLPPFAPAGAPAQPGVRDILVAGCGTGQHSIEVAMAFPGAQVLAVDLSRPSLAYARRKTREEGLRNIDYAQADILKLAGIGRAFDRIEAIGVLHHMAQPSVGWRVLLGLLRPGGVMRVGLYSEAARRAIVEARALIAARGLRPTPEDIRAGRQLLMRGGWREQVGTSDFHSISGCRDLLFNVMEHRFTIPEIKAFLQANDLAFLGFEIDRPDVIEKFRRQFPRAGASGDLDCWHAFETANPHTFKRMYVFSGRRRPA